MLSNLKQVVYLLYGMLPYYVWYSRGSDFVRCFLAMFQLPLVFLNALSRPALNPGCFQGPGSKTKHTPNK